MPAPLSAARRSVHVVPGSSERFLQKAPSLHADALMFDLEDGVASSEKEAARALVVAALATRSFDGARRTVRINAPDTPWMELDVASIVSGAPGAVDAIVLPKASSAGDVRMLDARLEVLERELDLPHGGIAIDVIIESARGLVRIHEILTASARVQSVLFGPLDFSASLGMSSTAGDVPTPRQLDALMSVRLSILVAGRSAGIAVLDGPFFRVGDQDGLRREARSVAELGFDGKLSIHPDQIPILNDVFTPSREEFDRAIAILEACRQGELEGNGAVRFEGAMIDEATRKLAESIVLRGKRSGFA